MKKEVETLAAFFDKKNLKHKVFFFFEDANYWKILPTS
jgi:hypothetical protein